jgi:hypothetical protein
MTEKVILLDYLRQKTNDAELFRKLLYIVEIVETVPKFVITSE